MQTPLSQIFKRKIGSTSDFSSPSTGSTAPGSSFYTNTTSDTPTTPTFPRSIAPSRGSSKASTKPANAVSVNVPMPSPIKEDASESDNGTDHLTSVSRQVPRVPPPTIASDGPHLPIEAWAKSVSSPLSSGYTPPSDAPLRSWGEKKPDEPTDVQPNKRLPRCTILLLAAVVLAVIVCVAVAVPLSLKKDNVEESASEEERTEAGDPSSGVDGALGRALKLSPAEQSETLETFNYWRPYFDAETLRWSNELADQATELAAKCTIDVSIGNTLTTEGHQDMMNAARSWLRQGEGYDPLDGSINDFAQFVWQATRQVGCGAADCGQNMTYRICSYDPTASEDNIPDNVSECTEPGMCGW